MENSHACQLSHRCEHSDTPDEREEIAVYQTCGTSITRLGLGLWFPWWQWEVVLRQPERENTGDLSATRGRWREGKGGGFGTHQLRFPCNEYRACEA